MRKCKLFFRFCFKGVRSAGSRLDAVVRSTLPVLRSVSKGFWISAAVPLLAALLVVPVDVRGQSANPCGCQDVADLINLLNIDHAVLDGLQEYGEKTVKSTDMVNEIVSGSNPTRLTKGDLVKNVIRQQINWVKDKQAHTASGQLDSVTCEGRVEADTPCLKSLLETREIIEKAYCKVYKEQNKLREQDDEMNFMPLREYVKRQRDLYSREIVKILRLLSEMPPPCRPQDWFGMITVYENMTQHTTVKTETTDDLTIRSGTIRLKGDSAAPSSSWQVGGKYINTKSGEGKRDCVGSFATPKPDTPYRTSFKMEYEKSGGGSSTTDVDLGEPDDQGKILIGFMIPDVVVKGDGQTVDTRESGCPNDSFEKILPFIFPNFTLNSERIQFEAVFLKGDPKLKGDPPEKISGAGTIPFVSIATADMKLSHTVDVTVHLYKLRR